MIRAGILLSAALAAAGCSGAPGAGEQAATDKAAGKTAFVSPNLAGGTWSGVFANPQKSIDNFSRIGLRPGPYEQKGDEWRSDALPTALTDPSAPDPVMAHFSAAGDKGSLERVAFVLVEPARSNDQQARDQFDAWMKQALAQLGVTGGDTAIEAIHGRKRPTGSLKAGANYAVQRETTPRERRLTVTFSRAKPILNGTEPATG
ncbi:hypothetical protein F1C10_01895 [Sphingomonas sp. NBWT7]|uniref:hypothetical protein n=1 Tax=Sphingomonas sp. NBWT7 TaxID=2596913 RepID=UPI001623AF94|nr:hypothetical protein [Sphingomonas sp. NBWT7]QNE30842.1 hypothetical protein F1C10_01895 [Sphingomonas sp. NBWT7]